MSTAQQTCSCTPGVGYRLPSYAFEPPLELQVGAPRKRCNIAIVGGGLAGLTLACSLAELGIAAVLLDEDNTVGVKGASSRGICYTQKSLEIFERLGIFDRVVAKGVQWHVGRTFAGTDEIVSFDLKQQASFNASVQPAFVNIQQFYNESFLVDRINQLNARWADLASGSPPRAGPAGDGATAQAAGPVELRWSSKLSAFSQTADCALLQVQTPQGNYTLEATHVVDASGAGSALRQWLGVAVRKKRGDDRWCIADVRFTQQPPTERHTWIEAPFNDNRAVWQHLMADDVWRIDYQMAPDADPSAVSRDDAVRARLASQFGAQTAVELVWVGPYTYRSECVEQMRCNHVFFMGDSAKVVSPFGARGGNTGIADAHNLAWKLAATLRGQADPALLESYHQERHEAATTNVQVTNRTARFLRPGDGVERTFRTAVIGLAKHHAFARSLVNTGRMAVANSYANSSACGALGGVSVQNAPLLWADGSAGALSDVLRWAGSALTLLVFGSLSPRALKSVQSLSSASVRCVQVLPAMPQATKPAPAREHVIDASGQLAAACQLASGTGWALVRPDAYLADRSAQWPSAGAPDAVRGAPERIGVMTKAISQAIFEAIARALGRNLAPQVESP